jgi:simple sugar transport system permease protein
MRLEAEETQGEEGGSLADAHTPTEKLAEALGARRTVRWPISPRVTVSLAALLAVIVVFSITTSGSLLHGNNVTAILTGSAQLGVIAVGVTLLMIGGEYDLSVGQTFVISAMVTGLALPHVGQGPAIVLGLLAAVAVGVVNGLVTVYLGLPSFIATLGMFFALSGLILIVSGGNPVSPSGTPGFYSVLDAHMGSSGLKVELIWWLGIAIVAGVVLERTTFGNHVFAAGGDRKSAAASGVRTNRVRMILFVVTALLAGFAGLIQLADIGTMAADAGTNYNLEAIAAAVIGGASLFGGVGGVIDSVIGSVFLGLVSTGLILSGANPEYYQLFVGVVMTVTVALYLRGSGLWDAITGMRSMRRARTGPGPR